MQLSQARRMLGLPYLREFANLGLSANAALTQLRNINISSARAAELGIKKAFNLSYRRTEFLSDYRRVLGIAQSRSYVSAVGKDKNLNPRRFPSIDMDIDKRYRYNVRMTLYNSSTGESQDIYRHVYSNRVLTRQEAGGYALGVFDTEFDDAVSYMGFDPSDWNVTDAVSTEAYHHKGWTY